MFFKRINENTINFIITPEDLAERGITLDDIFERRKEAIDYLKRVIVEAAQKENFSLEGNYTSMHITVMQDHTLCITLTDKAPAMMQDPKNGHAGNQGNDNGSTKDHSVISKTLREIADRLSAGGNADNRDGAGNGSSVQKAAASESGAAATGNESAEGNGAQAHPGEYGYAFYTMQDVINCARAIADADCYTSSLYENTRDQEYDLILTRKGSGMDTDFEKVVLAMNEFGDFIEDGPEYLGYIKEHMKCMCRDNAVQTLARL